MYLWDSFYAFGSALPVEVSHLCTYTPFIAAERTIIENQFNQQSVARARTREPKSQQPIIIDGRGNNVRGRRQENRQQLGRRVELEIRSPNYLPTAARSSHPIHIILIPQFHIRHHPLAHSTQDRYQDALPYAKRRKGRGRPPGHLSVRQKEDSGFQIVRSERRHERL
ncbi:hypothetical protein CGMCC3_g5204 [Colletotrichum fructicola]|nr:uncharacterized protein CGMCC3_g5204 [Colletotrichum fructicola]KAE9578677.1 hypothetical protein CGMCC3_g5204 [Colletotrichum fructicola]